MTGSAPGPALSAAEMRAVRGLLAAAWGEPARIERAEVIWDRRHVIRVGFGDGRSAVVKRRPRTGRSSRSQAFGAELAALEYLNGMPVAVAPRLLGADAGAGLMVMEDLGAGASLADALLAGDRARAQADLVSYARALAAMHAWSTRRPDGLATLRDRYAVAARGDRRLMAHVARGTEPFLALAGDLGLPVAGVAGEIGGLGPLLDAAGFGALVHGDACPDNMQFIDGACRIFDFENSAWGAAAIDAVFLMAPFPSCWCFARLPADAAAPAVAAYQSGLADAGIRLGPDWQAALAAALACWVVARGRVLGRLLGEDPEWGTTTMRPRMLAWLSSFLQVADGTGELHRLRELAAALLAGLSRRWPEAQIPDYPALARPGAVLARAPDGWEPGR